MVSDEPLDLEKALARAVAALAVGLVELGAEIDEMQILPAKSEPCVMQTASIALKSGHQYLVSVSIHPQSPKALDAITPPQAAKA